MSAATPFAIGFTDAPITTLHGSPDPMRLVQGQPQHTTQPFFESEDGGFITGIWESTPGKWRAFTGKDEFCYIVKGQLRLISDAGESRSFKTGDSFVIPRGFAGYWEIIETTTKHYAIRKYSDD